MKFYFTNIVKTFFVCLLFSACSPEKTQYNVFKGDLFDDTHLHEIHLNFASDNFWDTLVLNKKLKDSLEVNTYLKGNVVIDGSELKDVGLRFKGESSYDFTKGQKKSFKLNLNCFTKKQNYKGITRFNLNNNYKDPTLMREKLSLDYMLEAGLPAPKSAYAKVYINGEYWGVYLLVEDIGKAFLKRNFGTAKGNLYIGEPNGTLELKENKLDYQRNYRKKNNKKANEWCDLENFIALINKAQEDSTELAELDSTFALDNCLKTWAVNNLLVNVDAYNMMYPHNYYLYFDSTTAKVNWINYDYNYSYAAWNPKYTYNEVVNFPITYANSSYPLANLCLNKNASLQKRYLMLLSDLSDICLNEEKLVAQIKRYQSLLKEAVYLDDKKEYSNEEFDQNCSTTGGDKNDPGAYIPGLTEFVKMRKTAVQQQLTTYKVLN